MFEKLKMLLLNASLKSNKTTILKKIVIIYILGFNISYGDGARILGIFPIPSISHQVAFRPLMKELAHRGHIVTVVTTDPEFINEKSPPNFTEIDVHDISYSIWREGFVQLINGDSDDFQAMAALVDININIIEKQLNNTEFKKILKSGEKFDLVITEVWSSVAIAVGVSLKAPVIQISSLAGLDYIYKVYGVPRHRIIFPEFNRRRLNNLSVLDKIQELYNGEMYNRIYNSAYHKENSLIQRLFGENMLNGEELSHVPELLLLNVHPIWVYNRPVPPNVVFVGGIHQKPRKELPLELKSYLDSSRNGVIYMSFGTNVDTNKLNPARIKVFCNVFSQMPYDVLWKWNDDTLPSLKPDNVKISKWLPQSDLLRHPKIKVFITQAGLQSTDEAITAGVPLIAFPMLGDQFYNAEMYEYLKIGVRKDFMSVTESSLMETLTRVINDRSYQENIKRLNSTLKDQPQTSLERAVWWSEYVIRHGSAKHLRSPMANVTWAEFLMLDVIAVVLGILAIILTCFVYAVNNILKTIKFDKLKKS